ncbi:MAG: hypothetical protein K0S12_753 [Bacteroidetes bacterium]|nr:hypothetical protein [Bacteroidota bacterium]
METKSFKALLILVGLILLNVTSATAGIGERFEKFVGSEFSNFQGLYIIAGIVIASLVLYIVLNHFNKEEEKSAHHSPRHTQHRRHHHMHHTHKIIKKTQ